MKGAHVAVNEELLKAVLEEIRPNLQADGGDVRLVDVNEDGVVNIVDAIGIMRIAMGLN